MPLRSALRMSAPQTFGPFTLEARIAVGGTAEVYLARPTDARPDLPRRLVVKRLLPHFVSDSEGRTMFDREAQLHAAVTHENVVTVFFAGKSETGEPFLAMEYIDGVDGYRLLRKLRQENRSLSTGLAVHIACEVLAALTSVHEAASPGGAPLGIVHRDVTPSNIYLSEVGRVKLGDFGIARSTTRMTLRTESGQQLKGKFSYLSPEQVSGEDADHRSDLFSLAVVLAEMLLNEPLFQAGGQLAVLLAIRDCRLDPLEAIRSKIPDALFATLARALAREPSDRFQTAKDLLDALRPFAMAARPAASELAALVEWVRTTGTGDAFRLDAATLARASGLPTPPKPSPRPPPLPARAGSPAARGASTSPPPTQLPAPTAPPPRAAASLDDPAERATSQFQVPPSFVVTADGRRFGPWTFARLMEALATGSLSRGDQVDYIGRGLKAVEDIAEFARFLPPATATTNQLTGPGQPDYAFDLSAQWMLEVLARLLRSRETGVLFVESADGSTRKEIYLVQGRLHHVASSDASELLGEYLVRRGKLQREELDLALAVLPRYQGRIGDTLIALGLVDPVDIFRAIREQGRDRVADLFRWRDGSASFYRGPQAPHVEFPLDLDMPQLMHAGLEVRRPGEAPVAEWSARLGETVSPGMPDDTRLLNWVTWTPLASRTLSIMEQPMTVADLLRAATRAGDATTASVLRSLEMLVACRMLQLRA